MSELSAQVSLYPLGQDDLSPMIDEVLQEFEERGLLVEAGPMSSLLTGEPATLFAGLEAAARRADEHGRMVLVITVSNACAVPEANAAPTT